MKHRGVLLILSFCVTALIIAFWQTACDWKLVSPIYLPAPDKAWSALVYNFREGILLPRILITLKHMFFGWLLASIAGIALGSLIGISKPTRIYFAPTLEFMRPLPASALFPIAIALFGLTEGMTLFVISFGALWPTLLSTLNGFTTVKPRLGEVARILEMSRMKYITSIALPNAMPEVLAGMRLSLTIALILSVVGEILSGSDGLGRWILLQALGFRTPDLFAGVMLFGVIGYLSASSLGTIERRLLRWRA